MSRKSNRSLKLFWRALDKSQSLSSDRLGLHRLISSMLEDGETVDSFISDIRNQNRTIKGTLAILKESSKLEKELERLENASVRPTGKVLPALPSDEAWARYMKGRTPFNAENVRGTTEHVGHPIVRISKANYPGIYDKYAGKIKQGLDYDDMIRREDIWPIVTSETAEQFRRVDRYNAFKEKLANRKRMMGDYPTSVSNVGTASKEERDRFLYERDLLTIRMAKAIIGRRASGIGEVKGTFYNEPISWRQQLGLEDTGVSSDFDYLRKQEKGQKDRRKRAERFWNRKHDEASIRRFRAKESFKFAMYDSDEQFIQGAMRDKGWSRDQAEQVYFRNLTENTKWLRFIAKDNPKIAKNLIPIAKAVGKASGLPFIGGLFANPTTAIMALGVGAIARTVSGADEANATIKKWKAYEGLYGNPTDKQKRMARLAGIKDVANISKVYGRLNVQRGDAESYLMNIGMAFRAMDERSAQLLAESEGLSPEEVRLAKLYAGEGASKADVVDANIEYLKEIQQRGFETGSGARETMRSLSLSIPYAKSAVARGMVEGDERFNEQLEKIKAKEWSKNRAWSVASNYRYDDPEKYQAMADAIKNTWDEVHDPAEIDDRYRAGMYDNSVTNNDASRSVSLQVNVAAPQITTTGDPVDFAKGISIIGSRALSEYQSVIENTDTKRKQ